MLEHSSLLICAKSEPASDIAKVGGGQCVVGSEEKRASFTLPTTHHPLLTATIVDAESGQYLGYAAFRDRRQAGWFAWLRGESIKVFETEDASLLMTLYRRWALSRTWEVCDADDRRVGIIYRDGLWNAKGDRLAVVHDPQATQPGRFVSPDGQPVAFVEERGQNEVLLTFTEPQRDPFAKMTILGKVLLSG